MLVQAPAGAGNAVEALAGLVDALVIQAPRAGGALTLYSEDLSDGQVYDSVRVVSPFGPNTA